MRAIASKRGLAAVLVLAAVFFCGEGYYQAYGQDAGGAAPVACIADAGRTIDAAGEWEAQVPLDGSCSSDADSTEGTNDDINDFAWYEVVDICDPNRNIFLGSGEVIECNLPVGAHVVILKVTDSTGASDSNEAVITVEDMLLVPPLPLMIELNEPDAAFIVSGGDSNNPQGEPSGILPASQSSPVKSGKIIGWGNQVVVDLSDGFVAVAAGEVHSLGLKQDGSIVAWGANWSNQRNVPLPNSGFVAVAAGGYYSLGLKQNGLIVSWGDNTYGQCNVPLPNTGFVAVAAGYGHSLGLKQDGSIVAWGANSSGQRNIPSPNTGFVSISAGVAHSLGLKQNGSIVAWGRNNEGQCNVPSPNTDFVAIAAGGFHSLGLKQDGSIVVWGSHYNVPSPNTGFVTCAAGRYHSLGIKQDGSIVAWGDNSGGQCNIPTPNSGFIAVAAGGYVYSSGHSLGLKSDGSIVCWGSNFAGQCNVPSPNADFIAVESGFSHGLGLKKDGSIATWGYNGYGQCNVPFPNNSFINVAAGEDHSLGLKQDGSIVAWGDNSYCQRNVPLPNNGFVGVAAGGNHSLGLKQDGSIRAWGWNKYGQCNIPPPNTGFTSIAAGVGHSLGLKQDGSIVAWGNNAYGQCNVPSPNIDFVAITAGWYHSLGLKANGFIVGWGRNSYGQCNVPSPNTGFTAIAAGESHSLGLKNDGTIVAWGDNSYGECNVPLPNTGFVTVEAGCQHSLAIVVENRKPVACIVGGDQIVWAGADCKAKVVLDGSCSSDEDSTPGTNDDINDFCWYEVIDPCDQNSDILLGSGEVIECNLPVGEHIIVLAVTDGSGDSNSCSFIVTVIAPVEMPMNFTPGALNPRSQGNWLKAHFILPDGYNISDIDTNTPAVLYPLEIESDYINVFVDRGRFGEAGIEIGFQRSGFCDAMGDYGPGEVTVSGRLTTGRYFYGTDVIKVIANNFEYLGILANYWLRGGCGAPDWCGGADADTSGVVDLVDLALFDGCCLQVF